VVVDGRRCISEVAHLAIFLEFPRKQFIPAS
jgi:hypothetical protein